MQYKWGCSKLTWQRDNDTAIIYFSSHSHLCGAETRHGQKVRLNASNPQQKMKHPRAQLSSTSPSHWRCDNVYAAICLKARIPAIVKTMLRFVAATVACVFKSEHGLLVIEDGSLCMHPRSNTHLRGVISIQSNRNLNHHTEPVNMQKAYELVAIHARREDEMLCGVQMNPSWWGNGC